MPLKEIIMNAKTLWVLFFLALFNLSTFSAVTSKLYEYVDIDFTNTSYSGSPFELVATATYDHQGSNETITSQLFYKGSNTWTARFTGTKTGTWTLATSSSDSDLDGKTETINVADNPGAHGFMKQFGDKWGWQGTATEETAEQTRMSGLSSRSNFLSPGSMQQAVPRISGPGAMPAAARHRRAASTVPVTRNSSAT
jgi:hypothetical protein